MPSQFSPSANPTLPTLQQEQRVLRGEAATAIRSARIAGDLRGGRHSLVDAETLEAERKAAAATGYAEGWAEGQRAAQAEVRAQAEQAAAEFALRQQQFALAMHEALGVLAEAASDLEARVAQPMAEVENELIATAVELAETLIGRELAFLAATPDGDLLSGLDALRRAMDLAPSNRALTVRMHPNQAQLVQQSLESGQQGGLGRTVTVVADASIAAGDCLAVCDATQIDAQLGSAVARLRASFATQLATAQLEVPEQASTQPESAAEPPQSFLPQTEPLEVTVDPDEILPPLGQATTTPIDSDAEPLDVIDNFDEDQQ